MHVCRCSWALHRKLLKQQRGREGGNSWRQSADGVWLSFICRCHSKWNYHWSLVSNGDFSKLNRSNEDDEENKPKIRFKIIPPPPKVNPEPPPPPPPKKAASPKLPRLKRRVEVDVFRLCWKESWMSLKPPKYLYLKAKEQEIQIAGFTTIVLPDTRKYKAHLDHLGAEWVWPADKWTQCWEQVVKILTFLFNIHECFIRLKRRKKQLFLKVTKQ